MYGSWILYTVPGMVIISGYLPGLTVPLFMYIIFKILIRKEERYLEERFGEDYRKYKERVGLLFPKFPVRKKDE